jgi:hypothetical protein
MTDPVPVSIPQKRPFQSDDAQHSRSKLKEKNVHRESREKKDSWRKKETLSSTPAGSMGSGQGPSSGKHTGHNTPQVLDHADVEAPGLVRYRLPPPQFQDFYGHRAPPLTLEETPTTPREFFAVNDQ